MEDASSLQRHPTPLTTSPAWKSGVAATGLGFGLTGARLAPLSDDDSGSGREEREKGEMDK